MLLFSKIIVFLWVSIEYIYQVEAEKISDIAQELANEYAMNLKLKLPRYQVNLFKHVWDIIDRNEPVAKMREEIKPIAEKLITSQIGTSINPEVMTDQLEELMKIFDFMVEENTRFHEIISFYENEFTAEKIKKLDKEIQAISFNVSLGGKHVELKHNDIYDKYSNLLNSYDDNTVFQWFRHKNSSNAGEKIPFNKPGSSSSSSAIIRSATLFCEEIGGSSAQFQLQIEIDDNPLANIFVNILTENNDYGELQSPFNITGETFVGSPYNCVMEKYWDRPELITATGSRALESRYIMPINEGDIYMGISESKYLVILIQPWDKVRVDDLLRKVGRIRKVPMLLHAKRSDGKFIDFKINRVSF